MTNQLLAELEMANKEIERLQKLDKINVELIEKQDSELQRLHSIIKEVKEYLDKELWEYFDERNKYLRVRSDILEILDKENKE